MQNFIITSWKVTSASHLGFETTSQFLFDISEVFFY